jgi:uncharacterized protein (TIGR00661 family)
MHGDVILVMDINLVDRTKSITIKSVQPMAISVQVMRIIYGICAWGLGHATRSLPIMRKLIAENHEVMVVSTGRSLQMIRSELGDSAEYADVPDYPAPVKSDRVGVLVEGVSYIPLYINTIRKEMRALEMIIAQNDCDMIISDNRYGLYDKRKPSFLITHQLRIMNPFRWQYLERGTETYNRFFIKDGRRARVLVPDYKENGLSGDLSHNLYKINEEKIDYIGPLSDFRKKQSPKDIDVFFSVSGPEPHRTSLEETIRKQLGSVKGNVVFTLGKTEEKAGRDSSGADNVRIIPSLPALERQEMLNRSKLVISRSGYSTLIDIATIGTKAMFIPTPNQPEQEYLAKYHMQNGAYYSVSQDSLDLENDITKAMKYPGFDREIDVNKSVENAMNVFFSSEKNEF